MIESLGFLVALILVRDHERWFAANRALGPLLAKRPPCEVMEAIADSGLYR